MMKTCSRCLVEKPVQAFPRHRRMPLGVYSCCKSCKAIEAKESRARNPGKDQQRSTLWRRKNTKAKAAYWSRWFTSNGDALRARRRAGPCLRFGHLRQATPSWANRFMIAEAYALARLRTKVLGFPWEVDHKVPLKHKDVCGLHVEHNLQVIPMVTNRRKGTRLEVMA